MAARLGSLAVAALGLAAAAVTLDGPRYEDGAPALGLDAPHVFGGRPHRYLTETTGSGAALLDYDGDGDLDVYLVDGAPAAGAPGPPNRLYRNLGEGRFVEVAALAGVGDTGWGAGAAAADIDDDGDADLLVTNNGRNVFYRNQGDGTFVDATAAVGLGDDALWSASAAFGDVDGDGFLDLYVTSYVDFDETLVDRIDPAFCRWKGLRVLCGPRGLPGAPDVFYRNRGDGGFVEATEEAGLAGPLRRGLGVVFFDMDRDGDEDIYVANDADPDSLFENDGTGRFRDVGLAAGVAFSMYGRAQSGMGVDVGDVDEDGAFDLVVTNFQGDYNALRRNLGGGVFVDASDAWGVSAASWARLGWGVRFVDADLDGWLDLLVANGHIYPEVDGAGIGESYAQPNQLLRNEPAPAGRRFRDASVESGLAALAPRSSRGLAVGDLDDDGDTDAVVREMTAPTSVLLDAAHHRHGSIRLRLVGRRSNRDGTGAVVRYRLADGWHYRLAQPYGSYLATHDGRLLLGVGAEGGAEAIVVEWPSGRIDRLGPTAAGEDVLLVEGLGRWR